MFNSFSALSTKVMTRPGTGVHKDPNDAAGGLAKSFLEIRLPYVRVVHYPGSAPASNFANGLRMGRCIGAGEMTRMHGKSVLKCDVTVEF